MASPTSRTVKTVWKNTALPHDVHEYGKWVALADKRPLGEILGDILRPVLKERYDAIQKKIMRSGGLQLKRQPVPVRNGGRK